MRALIFASLLAGCATTRPPEMLVAPLPREAPLLLLLEQLAMRTPPELTIVQPCSVIR